ITIGYHPGASVGALATVIGFTQSAAVRSVDRLVGEGLMARERGLDKRSVRLSLTASGEVLRSTILTARENVIAAVVAPLNSSQQESLLMLTELMLTVLTDGRVTADHICRFCDENACTPAVCPVEREAVRRGASS